MPEIVLSHADDERCEDAVIRLTGVPPKFEMRDFETQARAYYAAQAGALLDVLYATLPGGTLDALLYLMLEREAGIYRVSYAQARGEK